MSTDDQNLVIETRAKSSWVSGRIFLLVAGFIASLYAMSLGLTHPNGGIALLYGGGILILVLPLLSSYIKQSMLISSDKLPALELDDEGINGSVALLEGRHRSSLVSSNQARFTIYWDDIVTISVLPGGHRAAPPRIAIRVRYDYETGNEYSILREPLYGREAKILDYIEQKSGVRAEIHDQLR